MNAETFDAVKRETFCTLQESRKLQGFACLEMCQYLEGFYQINNYLKCPIAADCEGDYEVYRSETQNLLPIFLEFDGIS